MAEQRSEAKEERRYYEEMLDKARREQEKREEEMREELLDSPSDDNYARWATEEEIIRSLAPILPGQDSVEKSGVPIFCRNGTVYADASDSHSMIIGASGSKKSRLFIMPTILNLMKAGESMILTDPKAELYERTAGRLAAAGYEVYCINFRDGERMNSWNPLYAPREFFLEGKTDLTVGLLNDFCTIAVPKDNRGGDPFWDDQSRSLFMGLLLLMFYLAEDPEEINIRGILRMRNSFLTEDKNSLKRLMGLLDPSSLLASYLSSIAIMPERTYGSVLATFDTHLMKFIMRPDLTDMLCGNDINFHKIGRQKTAVFLVMPDEKETYHGLVSIFVQQCYESLIFEAQKTERKTLPVRVNFLLDEFSSLPPIKEFPVMIAAARSRNIRLNIVIQSEKQLVSRYGPEAETIKGNCNNWIFLYSRELSTLSELSELCGLQKNGKPLVTPSRLQRLDKDAGEVLIIHQRNFPFLSHLDDISRYDGESFPAPGYIHVPPSEIRIFDLKKLLTEHGDDWFRSALLLNRAALLETEKKEAEERQKKREEEDRKLVEETTRKLEERFRQEGLSAGDVPVPAGGAFSDAAKRIRAAASQAAFRKSLALTDEGRMHSYEYLLQGRTRQKDEPLPGAGEPREEGRTLAPRAPYPLAMLPLLADLNKGSMIIIGGREEQRLSASLLAASLEAGSRVPILIEASSLTNSWGQMMANQGRDRSLLLYHIANQLFQCPMPEPFAQDPELSPKEVQWPVISGPLEDSAAMLAGEFSREGTGQAQYVLILVGLEEAPNAPDIATLYRETAAFPNLQVISFTSEPGFAWKNPSDFLRINPKDGESAIVNEAVKWMLYFDEMNNTVKCRVAPLPCHQLEIIRGSGSNKEPGNQDTTA